MSLLTHSNSPVLQPPPGGGGDVLASVWGFRVFHLYIQRIIRTRSPPQAGWLVETQPPGK